MAVVRKIPCAVAKITPHGERVYTVDLAPSTSVPRFKPGQFLHLALDPYTPGGFWPESRVFSIASSPRDRDRLAVTYAVKGAFTERMEQELTDGRTVWTKLPYGEFVIDPSRDAVLMAGGTGITAFTAFLQSLEPARGPRVLLFYGARTPELLVYRSLAESCAREVDSVGCRLVPESEFGVLDADAAWPAIATLDTPDFYLSGPPQMLAALSVQLRAHDVADERIRTDAWE